jgi:hypothetical protein
MGVIMVAAFALAAPPAGVSTARAQPPEEPGQVGALEVFIDQTTGTIDEGAISSYVPNRTGGPISAQAADDFIITTSGSNQYGRIQTITVIGQGNNGTPTVDRLILRVYPDAGGLPTNAPASVVQAVPSGSPNGTYVANATFIVLGNRRYWIAVQANVTSSGFATWDWRSSSSGAGTAKSAWLELTDPNIIPLDQFIAFGNCAAATTGWGVRRETCNIGQQDNMAFKLEGDRITLNTGLFLPLIYR